MTAMDELPPLEGSLSRRDLLRHLIAGNLVGYVVFYDKKDVEVAMAMRFSEPTGLGQAVISVCSAINEVIPEHDMELGTDLHFHTTDEEPSDFGEDVTLLRISADDAKFLLNHMPELFLDQTTAGE